VPTAYVGDYFAVTAPRGADGFTAMDGGTDTTVTAFFGAPGMSTGSNLLRRWLRIWETAVGLGPVQLRWLVGSGSGVGRLMAAEL
jgi:hypothetical protein